MNWIRPDNPYNALNVKHFTTVHGDGFEATLRMYASKIGSIISPNPLVPMVLQGLKDAALKDLNAYITTLGCTVDEFLRELILASYQEQELKQAQIVRSKAVDIEKKRLWAMLNPERTYYRLKDFAPGVWDYYGCGNPETIRLFCNKMHGDALQCILTGGLLADPEWTPPYELK